MLLPFAALPPADQNAHLRLSHPVGDLVEETAATHDENHLHFQYDHEHEMRDADWDRGGRP